MTIKNQNNLTALKESAQQLPEKPMVSVCCTTFQHGKFITEAIEGFLMQETNFPVEIIIRDDASKDGTSEIVAEYAAKFPNVIRPILEKENTWSKGVRPMATCMSYAQGKYIALCEGDDYWTDPLKLQKQVDFLESENNVGYVAVFHKVKVVRVESEVMCYQPEIDTNTVYRFDDLVRGWFIPTASLVFRNVIKHNIFLKFVDVISGDRLLTALLADKGNFYYMNEVMGAYRKHPGGISSYGDRLMIFKSNVSLFEQLSKDLSIERKKILKKQSFYWKVKVIEEYKSNNKRVKSFIENLKLFISVRSINDLKTSIKLIFVKKIA